MKKGFTLIELLAVIVVLAIIALIATPIVLNIIKDSKDSATLRSAENYMDAVANAIATTNMKEGGTLSITTCTIEESILNCPVYGVIDVDVDKEKPVSGSIIFNKGKVEDVYLVYTGNKVVVDDDKGNLEYLPEAVSFGTDSWNVIKANVNTGVYNVGDEREIELDVDGDGISKSYTLRIVNLPSEEENEEGCGTEGFSETACGFVVEFKDIILQYNMNPATYNGTYYEYGTNLGGWPASEMRKYIGGYKDTNGDIVNGTIYKVLPDDLKSVLKDTYVVSSHGSGDKGTRTDENFESIDTLYLLSTMEVWGSNPGGHDTSTRATRQLDYYKEKDVTIDSYSGAIKEYKGSNSSWWLRSTSTNPYCFFLVDSIGDWSYDHAYNTHGIAPAFRIG